MSGEEIESIIMSFYLHRGPVGLWVNRDIKVGKLGLRHTIHNCLKAESISLHICHGIVLVDDHTVGHVTQCKIQYWCLVHLSV